MKLEEAVKHYIMMLEARRYSEHTLSSYHRVLETMIRLLNVLGGVTELERVTVLHLRQCVQHLLITPMEEGHKGRVPDNGSTLSASSVSVYIRAWKAFFSWCYKEELIEKDPAIRLEYPKVPKRSKPAFSQAHIQEIFDVCDLSTETGFRDYLILLLLLDTGIRRSEIVKLRVEDVHDTYITVQLGKGQKDRQIGIHSDLSTLLWKYIRKYRKPKHPDEPILFLATSRSRAGLALGRGGMGSLIGRLKKGASVENVRLSAHTFRHTFAKMYLAEGGDLFSLSRELGHSDVKTTQTYLEDFKSEDARKHHSDFSPLNKFKVKKTRRKNEPKRKGK